VQDDDVFQPAAVIEGNQIAITSKTKANNGLDCAAAKVRAGTALSNFVLGVGQISGVVAATVGMRVVKSGGESGITEGVISSVTVSEVRVRTDPSFPIDYILSARGDSGSLWLEQGTQKAVALHRGLVTPREAAAVPIQGVLDALQLTI
jgi:hypothetical protein